MKKSAVNTLFGILALAALLLSSCDRNAPNEESTQPQGNETAAARSEAVDLPVESEQNDGAGVSEPVSAAGTEPAESGTSEETP